MICKQKKDGYSPPSVVSTSDGQAAPNEQTSAACRKAVDHALLGTEDAAHTLTESPEILAPHMSGVDQPLQASASARQDLTDLSTAADYMDATTTPLFQNESSTTHFPTISDSFSFEDAITVSIIDTNIEYELDVNDVTQVFSALADVRHVSISPDRTAACVLVERGQGARLVELLNGHRLQGMDGVLTVSCLSPPSPTKELSLLQHLLTCEPPQHPTATTDLSPPIDKLESSVRTGPIKSPCQASPPPPPSDRAQTPMQAASQNLEEMISSSMERQHDTDYVNLFSDWMAVQAEHQAASATQTPLRGGNNTNSSGQYKSPQASPNRVPPAGGFSMNSPPHSRKQNAAMRTPASGHSYNRHYLNESPASTTRVGDFSQTCFENGGSPYNIPSHNGALPVRDVVDAGGGVGISTDNLYAGCEGEESNSSRVRKWTARYDVQIPPNNAFQVTRRIIGTRGANMKRINQTTGAKLRLRGQGSGYLEGSSRQEADDPLHLCISCCEATNYKAARGMVDKLLRNIYTEYDAWCVEVGIPGPHLNVKARELLLPNRSGREGDESGTSTAWNTGGGGGGGGGSSSASRHRMSPGGMSRVRS